MQALRAVGNRYSLRRPPRMAARLPRAYPASQRVASSPRGTRRSLSPLPLMRTTPWFRFTACGRRVTSSVTRSPLA